MSTKNIKKNTTANKQVNSLYSYLLLFRYHILAILSSLAGIFLIFGFNKQKEDNSPNENVIGKREDNKPNKKVIDRRGPTYSLIKYKVKQDKGDSDIYEMIVPGDGRCMLHAIYCSLISAGYGKVLKEKNIRSVWDLRDKIIENIVASDIFLEEHWKSLVLDSDRDDMEQFGYKLVSKKTVKNLIREKTIYLQLDQEHVHYQVRKKQKTITGKIELTKFNKEKFKNPSQFDLNDIGLKKQLLGMLLEKKHILSEKENYLESLRSDNSYWFRNFEIVYGIQPLFIELGVPDLRIYHAPEREHENIRSRSGFDKQVRVAGEIAILRVNRNHYNAFIPGKEISKENPLLNQLGEFAGRANKLSGYPSELHFKYLKTQLDLYSSKNMLSNFVKEYNSLSKQRKIKEQAEKLNAINKLKKTIKGLHSNLEKIKNRMSGDFCIQPTAVQYDVDILRRVISEQQKEISKLRADLQTVQATANKQLQDLITTNKMPLEKSANRTQIAEKINSIEFDEKIAKYLKDVKEMLQKSNKLLGDSTGQFKSLEKEFYEKVKLFQSSAVNEDVFLSFKNILDRLNFLIQRVSVIKYESEESNQKTFNYLEKTLLKKIEEEQNRLIRPIEKYKAVNKQLELLKSIKERIHCLPNIKELYEKVFQKVSEINSSDEGWVVFVKEHKDVLENINNLLKELPKKGQPNTKLAVENLMWQISRITREFMKLDYHEHIEMNKNPLAAWPEELYEHLKSDGKKLIDNSHNLQLFMQVLQNINKNSSTKNKEIAEIERSNANVKIMGSKVSLGLNYFRNKINSIRDFVDINAYAWETDIFPPIKAFLAKYTLTNSSKSHDYDCAKATSFVEKFLDKTGKTLLSNIMKGLNPKHKDNDKSRDTIFQSVAAINWFCAYSDVNGNSINYLRALLPLLLAGIKAGDSRFFIEDISSEQVSMGIRSNSMFMPYGTSCMQLDVTEGSNIASITMHRKLVGRGFKGITDGRAIDFLNYYSGINGGVTASLPTTEFVYHMPRRNPSPRDNSIEAAAVTRRKAVKA